MTATIERLRRQTRTAEELYSVVKTMKSLAAATVREYEIAADSLEQYAAAVELGFRILIRRQPAIFRRQPEGAHAVLSIVIVGSDQGMVGRFNEEIAEHVETSLRRLSESRAGQVVAVGSRMAHYLEAEGIRVDAAIELPNSAQGIVQRVEEVLLRLDERARERPPERVLLAHHRPFGQSGYEPTRRLLLPVDPEWLDTLSDDPWPHRGIPTFTLPAHRLARALIRQYLLVCLQRAFAQSCAAENAKRLASMQAAENNVIDRLEQLQAQYRRRRQSEITAELLEVTTGFEVLERGRDSKH